ncbi:MAG: hypothetical protein EBT47_13720 [Chloroflexi bacterium]|nr:hypothetical protein [Chloroflexota bacterium]
MPVGSMVFDFFVPGISRMARASGADFLIFDTEHSGTGIESIKAQCAACDGVGIAPVVRVPEHGYHFVAGALDAGAHGVMVPMVGTAAQAREIVSFSHYPPAGRRGAAFGIAHDGYTPGTPQQKIAEADARTLVIAMIETPEGVANVDEGRSDGFRRSVGAGLLRAWVSPFCLRTRCAPLSASLEDGGRGNPQALSSADPQPHPPCYP